LILEAKTYLIYEILNKFINQIRAPGGHIQITIMIDTQQQYIKLNMYKSPNQGPQWSGPWGYAWPLHMLYSKWSQCGGLRYGVGGYPGPSSIF
jgi:hypothetical protein